LGGGPKKFGGGSKSCQKNDMSGTLFFEKSGGVQKSEKKSKFHEKRGGQILIKFCVFLRNPGVPKNLEPDLGKK